MTASGGQSDRPLLTIVGEAVALGPQHRGLAPLVQGWLNDFGVRAPLGLTLEPMAYEAAQRAYEDSEAPPDQIWFALYERAALRPIGITGLRDIDHAHGTAEFVIFIGGRAD